MELSKNELAGIGLLIDITNQLFTAVERKEDPERIARHMKAVQEVSEDLEPVRDKIVEHLATSKCTPEDCDKYDNCPGRILKEVLGGMFRTEEEPDKSEVN